MRAVVKVTYTEPSPTRPTSIPRPVSPTKPSFKPRAKINSSAIRSRPGTSDGPSFLTPRALSPARTKSTPTTPRPATTLRSRQSDVSLQSAPRIKSKVTDALPTTARIRAPSVSNPPPPFYPITTASPAANPHRYAPRSPPQPQSHYQPFRDPPLPPTHSPPASALSFSSRSSLSVPSTSSPDQDRLRSTLDNLFNYTESTPAQSETDDDDQDDADASQRKVKAQAKSNRKIADLEITNRSLLAINASLETAKHKQAKEIRDLRRKLRESRLILPPSAFRAVKANDADPEESDPSSSEDEGEGDETYQRIKAILDGLLKTGKRALETKPLDFIEGGAKVLHADEVRSWREEEPPVSPSHIAVPDTDTEDSFGSEDEVEFTLTRALSPAMRATPTPPP